MMTVEKKKGFLYSRVVAEHEFVEKARIFKDTELHFFFCMQYLKIQNKELLVKLLF